VAQGEFALVRQNMEASLKTAGQPVVWGTMAHEHDVYMMLAEAAAQQRDAAAIRQYAPLAEELALRDDHKLYLAIAQRALGVERRLAGEYAQSEQKLKLALEAFRQLGAGWQTGRTLAELGELALDRSDPVSAREYFTQALAEFETLGAAPDVERMKTALDIVAE
jgi:tetratricopeptide (TPR) repeat protein